MRGHRPAWRAAVAVIAVLGLVVSLAGCGPDPSGAESVVPATAPSQLSATEPTVTATASSLPSGTVTPTATISAERSPFPAEATPQASQADEQSDAGRQTEAERRAALEAAPEVQGVARIVTVPGCSSPNGLGGPPHAPVLQWLPDGSGVLFGGQWPQLYVAMADGTQVQSAVGPSIGTSGRYQRRLDGDVSPDGTRIAYVRCERQANGGDLYEIVVWHRATMTTKRVTNGHVPVWSPDATRLVFASRPGYRKPFNLYVYTMTHGGADRRPLATTIVRPPQWSPDGERLAFVRDERDEEKTWIPAYTIYVIAADRSAEAQALTPTVSDPSWSPDGMRIAFAKPEADAVALYIIATDGTDARRLTTITGWEPSRQPAEPIRAWIGTVAWSPDGTRILYTCGDVATCVVSADSTPVSRAPLPGNPAAWSPDSARIAILDNKGTLSTVAPDGSDVRVLARAALGGPIAAELGSEDAAASQAACADGLVVDAPTENPGLVRDCETLLEMRDALFPNTVVNWGPGTPIDQWAGVTVDGAPPRVTGLTLVYTSSRGGRIPAAIGALTHLRILNLSSNELTGPIPPQLGQLANLQLLNVLHNQLTGPIPAELGGLANLEVLDLGSNQLTGPIPPALGALTELRTLDLSFNDLAGPIPPELSQLANLTELNLSDNQLARAIPPELGQFANLRKLHLGQNQLTGAIPPELGHLAYLQVLNLRYNQLTGIPPELGRLANLWELHLEFNQLTGAIPPELGQLANLQQLYLGHNQLTGAIPPELGQIVDLQKLDLGFNQLTGPIPPELGQLDNVWLMDLSFNQLTGPIPPELGQMGKLQSLRLGDNQLTGCLPRFQRDLWGDLPSLGLPECEPG